MLATKSCKFKCKRILIIPGVTCLILPFLFEEIRILTWIALLYFLGSFMLLVNFPYLSTMMHSKPIYYEDLRISPENIIPDDRFKIIYELIMIFFLSGLIGALADYVYISGGTQTPIEFVGIVGGNISVYLRIQNLVGKILLKMCYFCKNQEETRELTNPNN